MGRAGSATLTSIRRMSIDRTVVKNSIWRKKSDTRPTTAKRQNSWNEFTPEALWLHGCKPEQQIPQNQQGTAKTKEKFFS